MKKFFTVQKILFLFLGLITSLLIANSIYVHDLQKDNLNSSGEAAGKPNIVVVMLDDVNPMDGRFFTESRTPHIYKNIVGKGINFTNFYVETTLCCPGRAGYLTGQHTQNHGVDDLQGQKFNPSVTIGTETKASGYYNIYAGKYLNDYANFPVSKRIPPGWDRFDAIFANNGRFYNYQIIHKNGTFDSYGNTSASYSTDVVGNWAVKRIKDAPVDKPIFAIFNPYSIHAPHQSAPRHVGDPRCKNINSWKPPDYDEEDVSDKADWVKGLSRKSVNGYDITKECEMLLSTDDAVGKIVAELKRQGKLQNTIFILTADNGFGFGEHRIPAKTSPYVTHVPLYISWPSGRGSSMATNDKVLSNIDIAPTICEIAGCVMGPYPNGQQTADGISFLSLIKNQAVNLGRDAILASQPIKPEGASPDTRPAWWAIRTTSENPLGLWHYIEYDSGEKELYDMSNGPCYLWNPTKPGDPCELRNSLFYSPNDPNIISVRTQLAARLSQLKTEKGYNPPSPTPTITSTPTLTFTPTPTFTLTPSPTFTPTPTLIPGP